MLGSKNIGSFDKRLTFLQPIITDGTSNEDKITGWEEVDSTPTVWGSKKDEKGNDLIVGDRVTYLQMTTFLVRMRTDITSKNRIVCDQQVYEVVSVHPDGSRRFLEVKGSVLQNVFYS